MTWYGLRDSRAYQFGVLALQEFLLELSDFTIRPILAVNSFLIETTRLDLLDAAQNDRRYKRRLHGGVVSDVCA